MAESEGGSEREREGERGRGRGRESAGERDRKKWGQERESEGDAEVLRGRDGRDTISRSTRFVWVSLRVSIYSRGVEGRACVAQQLKALELPPSRCFMHLCWDSRI
jgi:hypothetical protein